MIEIKSVNKDARSIVYNCPDCSKRFGCEVDLSISIGLYQASKWRRVDEFFDTHDKCSDLPIKKEPSIHPIVQKAIEIFDPIRVDHFPDMESL